MYTGACLTSVKLIVFYPSIHAHVYKHTCKFGGTALHFAVHEEIVELLLEAHADPDLKEVITVATTCCTGNLKTMPYDSVPVNLSCHIIALGKSNISNH